MSQSDDIKTRLDIVDVIREYIQLKPAGVNFGARCPFHNEKSASFIVSPEKQIWHCFGCGKGGDVFTFVMEMEGLTFVEVLRQLAPKAGIELRFDNPKETSQRNRLLDIMAEAVHFYHKTLTEHPLAEPARRYLVERGLTDETIASWQIGFSLDDWEDLQKYLLGKGFKENEIFLAGLSSKKEGTGRYYNRFRGRIMFPINDINGNPVAFTARVSPEKEATEKMGKYVNSPQTAIYDKGRLLFGLDQAKQAIKQAGMAILVEGQMDVITAHQHGYKNVVASSGTALTESQVVLLKRFTETIALAFDSDRAGQTAIERGEAVVSQGAYKEVEVADARGRLKTYIEPSLTGALNLKVIEIPNGKDPDDCIKTDAVAWELAVKNAKSIMQFYFDKTVQGFDIATVEGKREIAKTLLPAIAKLGSKIEQEAWVRQLARILNISENLLFEAMPKTRLGGQTENFKGEVRKKKALEANLTKEDLFSELFLALAIRFSEHFSFLLNHLELAWLTKEEYRSLYKNLVIYYNQNNDEWTQSAPAVWGAEPENNVDQSSVGNYGLSYEGLRVWLNKFANTDPKNTTQVFVVNHVNEQAALLDRLSLLAEKEYYQFTTEIAKAELIRLARELKKNFLAHELKKVEARLALAEQEKQIEQMQSLLQEFKILSEELRDITL
jgi:DNA primase